MEPGERRQATLLQQLSAIRNAKAVARRDARGKQRLRAAKKAEAEEAWRTQYNK
jgi:hypothetical protein